MYIHTHTHTDTNTHAHTRAHTHTHTHTHTGTTVEAYRAKLRLLTLAVTICSTAGHLTVFEKDAEEDAPRSAASGSSVGGRGGGGGLGGHARGANGGGAAKGVLLNVPLPEFDVAANATLVLALGGLHGHNVEWVSQGEARINSVPGKKKGGFFFWGGWLHGHRVEVRPIMNVVPGKIYFVCKGEVAWP